MQTQLRCHFYKIQAAMSLNSDKIVTPPSKSTRDNTGDPKSSTKALQHLQNELASLRLSLQQATQREAHLFNGYKKSRSNYNRALAETKRLRSAIESTELMFNELVEKYGGNKSRPGASSTFLFFIFHKKKHLPHQKYCALRIPTQGKLRFLIMASLTNPWMKNVR